MNIDCYLLLLIYFKRQIGIFLGVGGGGGNWGKKGGLGMGPIFGPW